MQHDLFHVYTVDQHILMVLRNVRRFFIAEHAHEYPFCSQLAAGWDKPYILYIAALFHDIAKGRGGDHSELGAREVRAVLPPARIEPEDCKLVEFLVSEHLTMSRIAQKEDLSNPDVIAAFAQRVGNERYLTALYLLTVADIRGTSPKVWNAGRASCWKTCTATRCACWAAARPIPTPRSSRASARRWCSWRCSACRSRPQEAVGHAGRGLLHAPRRRRHRSGTPRTCRAPRRRRRKADRARAPVAGGRRPAGAGLHARPADLFARICGYFDQAGFSILDAKVHTANNGYALDTFQVVSSMLPSTTAN
jgi:[protein-PII] uridylyltransferase